MDDKTINQFPATPHVFRVIGETNESLSEEKFYRSASETHLKDVLLEQPIDEGGFISFQIHPIEVLPAKSTHTCPHCGESFDELEQVEDV